MPAQRYTHIPRLFILDPAARKAYMGEDVTTMYSAMEQLYTDKIASLEVDTFVVVDTHWFSTIDYILNANAHLSGSYTSEELPDMIHDYAYDYQGDAELADWIAEVGAKHDVRVNACHYSTLPIHYPSLTTMRYMNPEGTARVLSVSVCQTAEVHNDLAFGRAIEDGVPRACPAARRVVFWRPAACRTSSIPTTYDPAQSRRRPRQHHLARQPTVGRAHAGPPAQRSTQRGPHCSRTSTAAARRPRGAEHTI